MNMLSSEAQGKIDEVASRKWSGEMSRCLVQSTASGNKHGFCAFLLFVMKTRLIKPSHLMAPWLKSYKWADREKLLLHSSGLCEGKRVYGDSTELAS